MCSCPDREMDGHGYVLSPYRHTWYRVFKHESTWYMLLGTGMLLAQVPITDRIVVILMLT